MKFLILGCNGMVGHVPALYFKEQGHFVVGYDEESSQFVPCEVGSFYDLKRIEKVVCAGEFDAIVNCTAIINQDAEKDKAEAAFINTFLPHYLEKITSGTNTIVVHRSTDCIYSGNKGQYTTQDIPDGTSYYAKTKVLGELINEKDITIRTSLIGPETESNGTGLFNWFYNQKGDVNGFANSIWTGLTTIEFAKEIEYLVKKKAHGLFQCVPAYAISKYELLKMFEYCFPGERNIIKIDNDRVDKSLIPTLCGYDLIIPGYERQLSDMARWINEHKNIYLNY